MSKTPTTLVEAEIQQLLNELTCPSKGSSNSFKCERNWLMGILMIDTGIRVGELIQLTARHLVFKDEPMQSIIIGSDISKTKTERCIPVSSRLHTAIKTMIRHWNNWHFNIHEIYLCSNRLHGKRMTVRQVERIIRDAAERSIGRAIHPHQLRHTFATRLMKVTNIRVVQELLGHKHLSSTQIYTHPSITDKIDAIAGMELVT